jgi:hypothetical protein
VYTHLLINYISPNVGFDNLRQLWLKLQHTQPFIVGAEKDSKAILLLVRKKIAI